MGRALALTIVLFSCALSRAQETPADPWDLIAPATAAATEEAAPVEAAQDSPTETAATNPVEAVTPRPIFRDADMRDRAETATAATKPESGGWLRSVGSLIAVVGLIVLLAWGYRVVMTARGAGLMSGGRAGLVEVVSRTALSPRHSACLVRIGRRLVLIGVSAERLTPLDVISDPEQVSSLLGQAQRDRSDSATRAFKEDLSAQSRGFVEEPVDERVTPDGDRVERARVALTDALNRVRKGLGGG